MAILQARELGAVELKIAAIALSRTERPSSESLAGLQSLLDVPRLRTQARYGLGTSVRRLREGGQDDRAAEVLEIMDRLRATHDVVVQVTALRAIANSLPMQPVLVDPVRPPVQALEDSTLMEPPEASSTCALVKLASGVASMFEPTTRRWIQCSSFGERGQVTS